MSPYCFKRDFHQLAKAEKLSYFCRNNLSEVCVCFEI